MAAMPPVAASPEDHAAPDVLVIGSGASGFAAALTARAAGLSVLMIEKAPVFGGTTCYSAGVIWVPGSRQARAAGIADSREAALTYLSAEGGNQLDRAKAETYVDEAADVLAWLEDNTHADFALVPTWPDYHPDQPGGVAGGRSLGPRPFDGRTLGARFADLRPPLKTTTILGGMVVGRQDVPAFYSMTRSWKSARHIAGLVLRHARDRLGYPRGTRLSNGNALIAMLARSAFEAGVVLRLNTPLTDFLIEDGRVVGAVVGGGEPIRARRGVVLASGGFPASPELRRRFYPHAHGPSTHRTLAPEANTGDGFRLGEKLGVATVESQKQPAAWTPVSLAPQPDGSTIPFPHFFDRGKAGYIAVDRRGRRFVNEARSYHDFVPAMVDACRGDPEIAVHLIADHRAVCRYGLGMAPPAPGRLGPHVRSGYIQRATTLAALARQCGIDPAGLEATVTRFNAGAARGDDPEFGKGGDVYQRFNGSAGHAPNPCVAPLTEPPYYAIRLVPGDIGTFVGLKTDARSRALDADGRVIEGLYVVGNDAASFMGGAYPGAGITIGPALVFGHLAGREISAS